jgi:pyridoxine 5-phosphate synthase
MPKLFLNVDHVATLREVRKTVEPDPVEAALIAERTGVHGITVHLREDRRHIQDHDVYRLKKEIETFLNLEMAAAPEIIEIAKDVKPNFATFVPEKRKEVTTEGGLRVSLEKNKISRAVKTLQDQGIIVSLFVDPDMDEIKICHETGAKSVEINTGKYSEAKNEKDRDKECEMIRRSIDFALGLGLKVNAGHGLDYRNIGRIARIKGISEFNIGHNIIARAVFVGLEQAVREMFQLIQ